ncbi:alpha/beta hydrolase-fold protein [Pseudoalteromonas rubra]|uniref:Esterase n=1 Tax=Pseudoalteromonas rubra TaxID=43658 RepID=A0A5S3WYM8_9GAMM|nr:alpha/beta hydrolase-fold protein [Pseudoalteromonas rubra]TMP36692.1 hypothetical protein CWB98_13795 [Pseudoalteromonas rubra]
MNYLKFLTIIFLFIISNSLIAAGIQSEKHTISFHSAILKTQVETEVYLPKGYSDHLQERYPVIITSSGDSRIEALRAQIDWLSHADFGPMPKVILLRIPNIQAAIPKQAQQGSMDQLLGNILVQELLPYLEVHYRAAPFRVLEGFSTWANQSLYLFSHFPEVYQAAILINPAWELEDKIWSEDIQSRLMVGLKQRYLYLSLGNFANNRPYFDALVSKLKTREHVLLTDLSEENYLGAVQIAFYHGVEALFSDRQITDFSPFAEQGISGLQAYYRKLKSKYGYDIPVSGSLAGLALYYMEQGLSKHALPVYEELIKQAPEELHYRIRYAQALNVNGKRVLSKEVFEQALVKAKAQRDERAIDYIQAQLKTAHF